jgi:hypothetical protein
VAAVTFHRWLWFLATLASLAIASIPLVGAWGAGTPLPWAFSTGIGAITFFGLTVLLWE